MKHVIRVVNKQIIVINEYAGIEEMIKPQYKDYVEGLLFPPIDDDISIEDLMGVITGLCELFNNDDPLKMFHSPIVEVLFEDGIVTEEDNDEKIEEVAEYYYELFYKRLLTLCKEVKVNNYTTSRFRRLLIKSHDLFDNKPV